ncbi:MAG TPA: hypothetical protein VF246_09445 [Acidimicrobiia bacterium]
MQEAGTTLGRGRRYAILAYGSLTTMTCLGLAVAGSILVGLALSVFLAGFGFIETDLELGTAAMMVSGLVIGVTGAFFIGLAAEGPLGRGRRLMGYEIWEIGLGRIVAVFLVGLLLFLLHRSLGDALVGMPEPILQANDVLRAVGLAGMIGMTLVGVPLAMAIQFAPADYAWLKRAETPSMFLVWAAAALIIL